MAASAAVAGPRDLAECCQRMAGLQMDWGVAKSTGKIKQTIEKQGSLVLNGARDWEGMYTR